MTKYKFNLQYFGTIPIPIEDPENPDPPIPIGSLTVDGTLAIQAEDGLFTIIVTGTGFDVGYEYILTYYDIPNYTKVIDQVNLTVTYTYTGADRFNGLLIDGVLYQSGDLFTIGEPTTATTSTVQSSNSIKLGSNNIDKLYLGSSEVDKVYLGENVVYEK